MEQIPPYVWPCVCIAFGIYILVQGIKMQRVVLGSRSWPTTDGKVLESTIQPGWDMIAGSYMRIVKPKVVYEYEVEGKKYTSTQLALVQTDTADEALAREKANQYFVGQLVTVYYNPKKPEFATLDICAGRVDVVVYLAFIIGSVATIAGLVWLLVGFH